MLQCPKVFISYFGTELVKSTIRKFWWEKILLKKLADLNISNFNGLER